MKLEQETKFYLTDAEAECLLGILAELLEGQEDTHILAGLLAQLYRTVADWPPLGSRRITGEERH